mgnify:CR=1 FL=1
MSRKTKFFINFNIPFLINHKYPTVKYSLSVVFIVMNLQEDIERIKQVMGLITERLSDIQGTPLYHKTSTKRGLDIISSDSLKGVLPSGEYLRDDKRLRNTKTQTAISFTRDKNWQPNNTIGIGLDSPLEDTGMTFVVDKDKLKTKYKIEPFNYHGLEIGRAHV